MLLVGAANGAFASLPRKCDLKFGCLGTFTLTVLIYAVAGLITAIATTSVAQATRSLWHSLAIRQYVAVAIASALLGFVLPLYLRSGLMQDDWSMFLGWLTLSGLVAATGLCLARALRPNNSLARSHDR
jgi:hypothetical protein